LREEKEEAKELGWKGGGGGFATRLPKGNFLKRIRASDGEKERVRVLPSLQEFLSGKGCSGGEKNTDPSPLHFKGIALSFLRGDRTWAAVKRGKEGGTLCAQKTVAAGEKVREGKGDRPGNF